MAQDSSDFDWNAFDRQRMDRATEELRASENLRFLFRTLMRDMGVGQRINSGNALETAERVSQYNSGMMLVDLLLDTDPLLYPALIEEDLREQSLRTTEGTYK